MNDFKHITKSNQIWNCAMAVKDMKTVEKICGKDTSYLKGKTTQHNPTTTTTARIAMAKELKE